jgi:hypothetical protein
MIKKCFVMLHDSDYQSPGIQARIFKYNCFFSFFLLNFKAAGLMLGRNEPPFLLFTYKAI